MGHEEQSQASSKSTYSHSSAIPETILIHPSLQAETASLPLIYDSDKGGLKFRPKLLFPSARQLCTRSTACKHFFVKHSITSCFMNEMSQSQGKREMKMGKQSKMACSRHTTTPPRNAQGRATLPAPLTGGRRPVPGKHQIHLFRTGLRFCGPRLCSLLCMDCFLCGKQRMTFFNFYIIGFGSIWHLEEKEYVCEQGASLKKPNSGNACNRTLSVCHPHDTSIH